MHQLTNQTEVFGIFDPIVVAIWWAWTFKGLLVNEKMGATTFLS